MMNTERSQTADRKHEQRKKTAIRVTDMDANLFHDVVDQNLIDEMMSQNDRFT